MHSLIRAILIGVSTTFFALSGSHAFGTGELECLSVQSSTLANIDTGGSTLPFSLVEMRIRSDGRPVILYAAGRSNAQSMRLINCLDPRCIAFEDTEVSRAFNYFDALGLALADDGRPLILNGQNGRLTYYECGNERCSLSRTVEIESTLLGSLRSLLVRPDGRPQLIYAEGMNAEAPYDIVSYTCEDSRCDSGTKQTLLEIQKDQSSTLGATVALDSKGNLAMSFLQNDGSSYYSDLQFLKCGDANCTTVETATISSEQGYRSSLIAWMRLLGDDRPVFVDQPFDGFGTRSKLIECADSICQDVMTTNLNPTLGRRLLGIGAHNIDHPLMGTLTEISAGFYVCDDPDCMSARVIETTASQPMFNWTSLQAAEGVRPMFVYFDEVGTKLRLLQCDSDSTVVFASGFE